MKDKKEAQGKKMIQTSVEPNSICSLICILRLPVAVLGIEGSRESVLPRQLHRPGEHTARLQRQYHKLHHNCFGRELCTALIMRAISSLAIEVNLDELISNTSLAVVAYLIRNGSIMMLVSKLRHPAGLDADESKSDSLLAHQSQS